MPTSIIREFLGWEQPLLPSAVEWLTRKYAAQDELNLGEVIVVVPGRRAGRRLLELLVQQAENKRLRLTPPRIETLGELPEQLYPLQRPLASDLVQQLTWAKVLRESDRSLLEKIIPRPPGEDDVLAWWSLGTLLWNQHRELAADGRDFGDVAKLGRQLPDFTEATRWDTLQKVQQAYLETLDELKLWDVQTARLVAIKRREPQTDRDIVLVGTVDRNQSTRQILDLVANRVTALIAAPRDRAESFDSQGCLLPAAWTEIAVDIPADRLRVCDGPTEQAEQIARELSAMGERFRSDEVVIGLADDRLGSFVERQLDECGVATRWIEGTRLADSGPCRLLTALADFLERGRFDDFAALVRHPDLDAALALKNQIDLAELDTLYQTHLPLGPETLLAILEQPNARRRRSPKAEGQVENLPHELLRTLRNVFAPLQGSSRALNEWAIPLRMWLATIYGEREVDDSTREGRILVAALKGLNQAIGELAEVPLSVAPVVSAADAVRCAVKRMSEEVVPPEAGEDAVELLGWLELPLDDTPAAIVTSFNEGFVPTSLNSDLFLPNELRQRLGLNDNARRYARDAYAVTLLQHARREVVWLVSRRDLDGNPQIPSRLLFAVPSDQLPERVLLLMNHDGDPPHPATEPPADRPLDDAGLSIPQPKFIIASLGLTELQQPTQTLKLNVTEFKSYLACPYRYFLRHVLKLESLDDRAVELDTLAFGNVLHDVLRLFGESDVRDSADEARLRRCLLEQLDEVARQRYGLRRRAAVNVQLKQLEARLEAFAHWQAKWRSAGWRIEHVERSIRPEPGGETPPSLVVAGIEIWLHGRLDRIDYHEDNGQCAIFDYKSGDKGQKPGESHRKRNGDWIDLQLPLYRHLARHLALPSEPRLGYINLPKDLAGVGPEFAEWSPNDFAEADEVAKQI
ncbi:MAG: PD-(D/E)XK nuclease family protein, partial [Planctomycetaceae bacterium]|nr:PD-(D/E)XK nuclease family protein [Planctomycetaceae bacterium]